jgi:hypothetical protein
VVIYPGDESNSKVLELLIIGVSLGIQLFVSIFWLLLISAFVLASISS